MIIPIVILTAYVVLMLLLMALLFLVIIPTTLSISRKRAPFVPTRSAVVPEIINLLKMNGQSILYDLGCGDGRILLAALESVPGVTAVGVDNDWLPVFLARRRTRHMRARKAGITIIKGDIFKTSLRDATHIYSYLLPLALEKLEPKILAECRPGTRIVACDFIFPNIVPVETVPLPGKSYQLARKLYLYVI